jgi:hypothetical protein
MCNLSRFAVCDVRYYFPVRRPGAYDFEHTEQTEQLSKQTERLSKEIRARCELSHLNCIGNLTKSRLWASGL